MKNSAIQRGGLLAVIAGTAWLLSACGGGTSNPTVTTPPPTTPPPTTPPPPTTTKVTLTGRVVDAPIPNAAVVATVGSTTLRTVADASGNYTLPVEVPNADTGLPVVVTATGVGDQANVKLVSLPGAVATLVNDAGADAVLTAAENIRSNVTHVSTAESALVMELTAGAVPAMQAQLEDLLKQINPEALFNLAATIKLIVDTPNNDLPAGVTDTLAFAQNASVREAYIQEVQEKAPEDLEAAKQDTANSADAVMQTAAGDIPAKLYLTVIDNDARVSVNSGQFVDALTFNADGSGSYYNAVSFTPTTWSLASNRIRVTLAEQPRSVGFPVVDTDGDGNPDRQIRAETTISGYSLVFLSESLVSITTNFSTVYPNREIPDKSNQTETISATVILPATDFTAFLPANFASAGGSLLTSTYRAQDESLGLSQFSGDILNFSAGGTASGQFTGSGLNWAVAASGTLSLSRDGATVTYNGLDIDFANQDANTQYVFSEISTANARYVDIVKVFQPTAPLVFDPATLKGSYFLYGLDNREEGEAFDGRLMGFSLEFAEDRTGYAGGDFIDTSTGSERVVRGDFNSDPVGFLRWSVEADGSLLTRRVFDPNGATAQARRSCDPASNSRCVVWDERRLVPFGRASSRHYWLEVRRVAANSQTAIDANTPVSYTPRYWDMTSMVNAITGSWEFVFPAGSPAAGEKVVVSFMGDGKYVVAGVWNRADCKEDSGNADNPDVEQGGNGWEKGNYAWNPTTGALLLSNVTGTDGDCGFVEGPTAGYQDDEFLSFQQDGSLALSCLTPGDGDFCAGIRLKRIASAKRSLTGGWNVVVTDPTETGAGLFYFFPNKSYLQVDAFFDSESTTDCRNGGIEFGNFSFDAASGRFDVVGLPVDTSGSDCGLNDGEASDPAFFTFLSDTQARYRYQSTPADEEDELIEKITTP